MVFAPPQHGKSECCSVRLPAYWLGRRPDAPVILSSYAASLAEDKSRQVRQIIESDQYARLFPGIHTQPDSRARNLWHLEGRRGKMLAVGVGGPVTGHGGLLGLIDDPVENWEQAQSKTYRDRAWDWYRATFRTRIWEGGAIVLVMTRWHKDDLAGRLLADQASEWTVLRLPALAEAQEERDEAARVLGLPQGEPDPLGREAGEPLCPQRFSSAELQLLRRDVGPLAWPAEYQGVPREAEGAVFKRSWFGRYEDRGDHGILIPSGDPVIWSHCPHYVTVDPAASEKQTSDHTAIGVFAVAPDGRIMVRHMVRERLGITGIVPRLAGVCRDYRPAWVAVEANGFQVAVAKEASAHPDIPTVMEVTPQGKGKLVRAHAAIIRASKGEILLPVGDGWVDAYLDELVAFTGHDGGQDDQVDVTAYFVTAYGQFGGGAAGVPLALHRTASPGYNPSSAPHRR